jgi:hypothetical protein
MSTPFILSYMSPEQVSSLLGENNVKTAGVGKGLGVVAKGLAGFGVGTAAGYGVGHLADKVFQVATGERIPGSLLVPAATLLGAGMGLAYSTYKAKELEELQRALKEKRDKPGVPRK